MTLIDLHWGWITPGVGQANRRRQLDLYMDILDARRDAGDRFLFTQPGWLMDLDQAEAVKRITTTSPEKGKSDGPMRPDQLERFKEAVRRGQLVYVAYPYSGAVVEGMVGEAVLKAYRLSRAIAAGHFGTPPSACFVHDGPFQLDWNAPMIPQIVRLAGFTTLVGRTLGVVECPDGTRLPMLGQPLEGTRVLFTGTEAPHLPVHAAELRERFGDLACATADEVGSLLDDPALPALSSEAVRTKGWYGGAPLVMQQQAALRRADLAIGLLAFNGALRGEVGDVDDLWKRSLVLQDCHLQWLLADVGSHYLPLARELEAEVRHRLQNSEPGSQPPSLAFNPLPHARSGVVRSGETYLAFANVAPASTAPVVPAADSAVRATATSLENNRIRVELDSSGRILAVRDAEGTLRYAGAANQIRHWVNRPADGEFLLRTLLAWEEPFSGNIRLETEVEIPADGVYPIRLDVLRGLAVAVAVGDEDWVRATNGHWGGGLPSGNQDHGYSQNAAIRLRRGRNRIVLHAVADAGFKMRSAHLVVGDRCVEMQYWRGRKVLEWAPDPFRVDRVDVCEQGARATVTFIGVFATCSAKLAVSLDHDSERIDVRYVREYAHRVHEGLQTLPLPADVGSYLGSSCERPYVPAFTVEHRTAPRRTTYASDKPYGFSEARDSDRAWATGRFRELYEGMAPFLGTFVAIAESACGSLAMLTDGHGHFFRRRPLHEDVEALGLGLGATIIHPMTQNYRMEAGSYWEKIGRGPGGVDYDDAHERFDFVCPEGEVVCGWSLVFSPGPRIARTRCHEQLLESLFPLQPTAQAICGGFVVRGEDVVLAAMEAEKGGWLLRLVNLADAARPFVIVLPFPPSAVDSTGGLPVPGLRIEGCGMVGSLPPLAVREVRVGL